MKFGIFMGNTSSSGSSSDCCSGPAPCSTYGHPDTGTWTCNGRSYQCTPDSASFPSGGTDGSGSGRMCNYAEISSKLSQQVNNRKINIEPQGARIIHTNRFDYVISNQYLTWKYDHEGIYATCSDGYALTCEGERNVIDQILSGMNVKIGATFSVTTVNNSLPADRVYVVRRPLRVSNSNIPKGGLIAHSALLVKQETRYYLVEYMNDGEVYARMLTEYDGRPADKSSDTFEYGGSTWTRQTVGKEAGGLSVNDIVAKMKEIAKQQPYNPVTHNCHIVQEETRKALKIF